MWKCTTSNGSADFYNKADYGIVVERDKEIGITRVYVDKVKFKHLGVGGVATFVYDPVNGRYLPCEESHDPASRRSNVPGTPSMTALAGFQRRSCSKVLRVLRR